MYCGIDRGLVTAGGAIETEQAKRLIEENRAQNQRNKIMTEQKIADLIITADTQEYIEETPSAEEKTEQTTIELVQETSEKDYTNIIILSAIGLGILICIVIIIIDVRKR